MYTLTEPQRTLALSLASNRQRIANEANRAIAELNAAEKELVDLLCWLIGAEGNYHLEGDATEVRLMENEKAPE